MDQRVQQKPYRIGKQARFADDPNLEVEWTGGCRNAAELWRRLRARGFVDSLRVVTEWAARRRRAESATDQQLQKVSSAGTIDEFASWMEVADDSLIASFARSITKDHDAVHVAISEPWSSGQVEGQVNKLKLVKRQMSGRAMIDLLEARRIGVV